MVFGGLYFKVVASLRDGVWDKNSYKLLHPEVAERLDEVSKSAASSKQEIAHLREELQKLPSEQEAEHSEASQAAGPKAATPEVQTLHESLAALSEEMASSRGEFSKLQEEV